MILECLFVFDLFHELAVYTPGAVYLGVYLFKQAYSLKRKSMDTVLLRWNIWYTVVQIFFYLAITLSCILMSDLLFCFIASAGLAILILLSCSRVIYIAYLCYVISIS